MEHADAKIIDALGGTNKASAALNVPATTVSHWRRKGIPRWRMDHVQSVIAQHGAAGAAEAVTQPRAA